MPTLPESSKQEMISLIRRFKREKFQPYMTPEGVTPSETSVIITIFIAKEHGIAPVQPRQVAEWLHLTPSALSQTLKVLDEKGFIERRRSSEDSRAVSLELTGQGIELAEETARMRDRFIDDMVDYIGIEDVNHLLKTFNKLFDFMSEQADAGAIQRGACSHHGHSCLTGPELETIRGTMAGGDAQAPPGKEPS